jgi:hypothetical protein
MNATVWSAQLVVPVLPNRDHIRGPAFARVTLLEYCDHEGPYCSVAHATINRIQTQLQSRSGRGGGQQDETRRTSCQPLNVLLAAFADEPVGHRQRQRNGRQAQ